MSRSPIPGSSTELLARHVPEPAGLDFIRQRVYTLHARIAGAFRKGHVLIAGDAAHLMPVWQGQGFNSGVRDATNLAWKLTAVLRGLADDALLDTYDTERRDHAKAMIDVSVAMGRILSPTNKAVAGARDELAAALNLVPAAKRWIAEGRYKPKPRFHVGALVDGRRARRPRASRSVRCSRSRASTPAPSGTSSWTTSSGPGSRCSCGATTPVRSSTSSPWTR